jgi:hypothetical protein
MKVMGVDGGRKEKKKRKEKPRKWCVRDSGVEN